MKHFGLAFDDGVLVDVHPQAFSGNVFDSLVRCDCMSCRASPSRTVKNR